MNYRAVGNRCAIQLDSLNLPITLSKKAVLERLQELGFSLIDIDIASLARTFIGKSEYRLKATMDEAPHVFDCSSFTKYLYAQQGIWVPRLSIQQKSEGVAANSMLPGDLVFTTGYRNFYEADPRENIGHVGIATAEGTIIHATNGKGCVRESTYEDFHCGEPRGIRRIIQSRTVTLEQGKGQHLIETADDFRWLLLRNID